MSEKPLPPLDQPIVEAVADWLYSRGTMQRWPEGTAKLLLFTVLLHRKRLPWPTRETVARHCGVSIPSVDLFKSQRRAEGLIEAVVKTEPGKIRHRASVVTRTYLQPCEELRRVVRNAERRMSRRLSG